MDVEKAPGCSGFQSTLPLWGATITACRKLAEGSPISIHAPPVGSDYAHANYDRLIVGISIHAPPVGSDYRASRTAGRTSGFQSTLPLWGATVLYALYKTVLSIFQSTLPLWGATILTFGRTAWATFQSTLPLWGATMGIPAFFRSEIRISIHAPPVGSDQSSGSPPGTDWDFNPRSPCGERPSAAATAQMGVKFQSTLPLWGATRSSFRPR